MKLILFIVFFVFVSGFVYGQSSVNLNDYNDSPNRLRGVIEKYREDYNILNRFNSAWTSANRAARFKKLNIDWLKLLQSQNFDSLNHDEQIDYLLFRNYLLHENKEIDRNRRQFQEISSLIPFAEAINDLEISRRKLEPVDSAKSAEILNDLYRQIQETQKKSNPERFRNRSEPRQTELRKP